MSLAIPVHLLQPARQIKHTSGQQSLLEGGWGEGKDGFGTHGDVHQSRGGGGVFGGSAQQPNSCRVVVRGQTWG